MLRAHPWEGLARWGRMPPEAGGTTTEPPSYGIAAVERTLDVVAALVRLGPATLTDLAEEADCTRVNAFRILHTLQARGLAIQQGRRGAWLLGANWLSVARAAQRQGAVPLTAAPVLAALAESSGDSVYLAVRDGQDCEVVAVQPGAANTQTYARPGDRTPLHAGPGRLLLAYAPEPLLRAVLAGRPVRLGPGARTDPAAVAADLDRIRKREWLITTHEIAEGAVSVSSPVRDKLGAVIAVLSIASPAIRMRPPRPHTLLTPLQAACMELGRALGG